MSDAIKKVSPLGMPWQTHDPFLFCVHHNDRYPRGNTAMGPDAPLGDRVIGQDFSGKDGWSMYHGSKVPGFPSHPHRGFETVTIVQQGFIDHADSLGAAARFGQGDVQWMTAGKGVQHSEMFPLLNNEAENPLELFQIWLNLPREGKLVDPYFQMMWHEQIPVVPIDIGQGHAGSVKVVAGSFGETKAIAPPPDSWAANDTNHVAIWLITFRMESSITLPNSEVGVNRSLYFFEGKELSVAGRSFSNHCAIDLDPTVETVVKSGVEPCKLLMLQGKPINQPVAQHGSFVMNNEMEIRQTMLDYQKDRFGGWPWPDSAQVHPRSKGRFARYVDGHEEFR
jgi:redox-sensitive bicupin YhaK (pirin superfamily)